MIHRSGGLIHRFVFAVCLGAMALSAAPAVAQNVADYISIGAVEDWVVERKVPRKKFKLAKGRNETFHLVDHQLRMTRSDRSIYRRVVETLHTSAAVESDSNLFIRFDPAFQTVVLHHLNIVRDGEIISRLDLEEGQLYRVEKERDRLIYNHDLEFNLILYDVRVGDKIDYAYTVHGHNPAFGDHFVYSFTEQYSVPVQALHERLVVSDDLPVDVHYFSGGTGGDARQEDGWQEWSYSRKNAEAWVPESSLPSWHVPVPTTVFTSYSDWSQVAQHFTPFYAVPDASSASIEAVAHDIMDEHKDDRDRVRAVLSFIQREIRYLGIEIGAGGYIPRQHEWHYDIVHHYDLVSDEESIPFRSEVHYYGSYADAFWANINQNGNTEIERLYREYYQQTYPTLV